LDTALNPLTVGSHNVSLTVTDTFGATSTVSTVVNVQRVLVSIEVTPAMATIGLGGQQSFQAIGHYNDGSTQVLSSDNGGGGGGSGPPLWQVHFGSGPGQGLNVDACTTPQYPSVPGGYSSQVFAADQSTGTIIPTVWSPSTPIVQVNGTITPAAPGGQVVATLTCTTPGVPATGSIAATWSVSQSRYIGTFTDFAGHTGSVTITGWSPQAAMPTRRFSFGAATVNGLAYAIGGGNELSFVTAVDAFNPATDMWTTGFSPMPTAREGLGVAALNQRIYAIGGHVAGGNPSGVVEVYDPVADIWTTLPQSEWMPTPRAGLALVADGNYLFAIGGATQSGIGGQVAIVERYDPAAHTWSTLTPMPVAGTASAGVLNGTIVVFGSGGTTRTDLYDIATDMWHPGVPMPAQRGGMAVAAANGGLWLVGGTSNGAFTYDTWVYYPATGTRTEGWAGIGPMLTARLSLAAAVVDDVVYAIGGAIDTTAPVSPLSTNEALSTPPFGDLSTIQSSSSGAVQWQSTNGNVATIDQNGNATGVATGSTTIIASAGSITCLPDHCGELTVINRVPIVQIFGGPYNTNESQFQNFGSGGSFSDLDPQSWTATVDYGDGTGAQALSLFNLQSNFTPTGQFNLSHAYRDNGVYTVTVTVDDDAGGVGTATAQVTVNNVAPQVSGPSSATLQLGSSQNFGCAALFDSGTLDAPWSATVDYGDGAGPQVVTNLLGSCGGSGGPDLVGAFNLSHVYTSTGTFTVTATATDKDGGVGTGTTSVTVNKAMPSMSLSVSPSGSITYGQNVTFTATVTTSMTGIAAPTGTVTFTVDGTPVAAPGLVSGQASYSTSSLNVGNHNIVATYSGDVNFNSVLRNTSRFIGRISPSMTLTSSSPSSTLGEAVTFTATVADPKGVVTATGPVTFTIDGSQVASPNLMNGQATFSTSGLSLGSHGISASYNGDANFFSSSRFTGHFVNACQGSIRGTLLNHGAPFTGMVQFIVTAGADTFPFTTDTGGFFFDEVDEGTYHLQVVPPPGYTATPAELDFTVSCGQQADLIFEVGDTTPPAITLNGPNPMTIEGGSTFADPGATATDSLAGDLTPAIVAAGTVDTTHVGSYTRTYTVSDGYNSTSTTRTVSVVDTTPPAFTSPPSATINATSPAGASYFYTTPAATDAVVGTVTVACNPPPGSVFPIGTTIVTCTATDQAGNSTTHVFTVTILSPQDMIANLISQVGELDFRQTSSLLQNVLRSLDNSNTGAGCNQLAAFIAQVQAQSGKKLTVVEATALIQAATDARGALGCG
jgi:PKD repeat protein